MKTKTSIGQVGVDFPHAYCMSPTGSMHVGLVKNAHCTSTTAHLYDTHEESQGANSEFAVNQ